MIDLIVSGASLAFACGVVVWARRQAKKYPDRPAEVSCKVCAAIEDLSDVDSGDELPDGVIETLRAVYSAGTQDEARRLTPVSQREVDAKPQTMPRSRERFVIWSRGSVDTESSDPSVAKKAWNRVIARAGIHQFWDSEHSIERPRTEKTIPLAAGDI